MGRIRNAILDRQYELAEEEEAKYMGIVKTINEKLDAIQQSIKCLEILVEQNQNPVKLKQKGAFLGGMAVIISLCYYFTR